jgi:hypothetical protein
MKKKGGGRKKAVGVSTTVTKAAGSAGTPKKKKTSAKNKNNNHPELSDLEETPYGHGRMDGWTDRHPDHPKSSARITEPSP